MIDRRELIHRAALILGGAVSSSAMAGVLAGCVSAPPAAGDKQTFLSPEEMRTAAAIADQIIPRTDTPGAVDAGVPAFWDKMLAGYYQDKERRIVREGLRAIAADAAEHGASSFAELTSEQQAGLMKEYDREAYRPRPAGSDPHFFRVMKELTIVGFCTSEAGATKLLKYEPTPGPFKGDIPYASVGRAYQS